MHIFDVWGLYLNSSEFCIQFEKFSSLVQVMVSDGNKPLPEPTLTDPK